MRPYQHSFPVIDTSFCLVGCTIQLRDANSLVSDHCSKLTSIVKDVKGHLPRFFALYNHAVLSFIVAIVCRVLRLRLNGVSFAFDHSIWLSCS